MLYKACKTDLRKQLAHPKVAQPKLGAYSAPNLLLVSIPHPARMPDGPAKRPGAWPTSLNATLKDYHYPLPTPEEVFNKMNGGVVFSKVDFNDTYL